MISVYLDNQPLAVEQDTSIGLSVGITRIEDPTSASSSYTKTIKIPMTAQNVAAFRHCEEILSPDIFNNAEHTARVEQDGIELISGKVFLQRISRYRDGSGYYELQILGDEFDWVERIRDKAMNELNGTDKISQYARYANLTPAQRANAFFALVDNGCWWQEVGGETVRRNWATYADLMPFISLRAILNEIFRGYEITIEGNIASVFDLLYVTGQFRKSDNASVLAEDNDFKVITELLNEQSGAEESDEYGIMGKITSDAAPVDLRVFDTIDEDKNGRITITGTAENRNVRASFTPSEECVASFNVKIGYQTTLAWEEKMIDANSTEESTVSTRPFPIFADTVYFGGNLLAKFKYTDSDEWANRELLTDGDDIVAYPTSISSWKDWSSFDGNKTSLFYIEVSQPQYFKSAGIYKFAHIKDDNLQDIHLYMRMTDFVANKMFVRSGWQPKIKELNIIDEEIPNNIKANVFIRLGLEDNDGYIYFVNKDGHLVLQEYDDDETKYMPLMGTVKVWGFSEKEKLTFENSVLSTGTQINPLLEPYVLQASVEASDADKLDKYIPKYDSSGNYVGLGVRPENGELTIYATNKSEVSPKFNNVVLYGSNVSMNDIGGDAKAVDMIKSIMQLFNLRIYANPDTKRVHLIPFDSFYTSDEVDWTDRIDYNQNIGIASIGDNVGNKLTLSYQDSSAPVSEYNERHTTPLNSYSVDLANKTSDSEKEVQNAVFNPPISERSSVIFEADKPTGNAADMSAWILKTAGKDTQDTIDNIDYELPRTLVLLSQVQDPFSGTIDIATSGIGCYGVLDKYEQPIMNASPILDFAGRIGLHRHYDKQVEIWNSGKQITCYCRILPQEIEALRKYEMHPRINFRSKFRIRLFGEDLLCRLQSVENYEPSKATCKCTFIYNSEI